MMLLFLLMTSHNETMLALFYTTHRINQIITILIVRQNHSVANSKLLLIINI